MGWAHMGRQPIDSRIDRHRLEALLVAGADDAQGDLAAVGDQYAPDGRGHYFRHVGTSAATLNVAIAAHSVGVARAGPAEAAGAGAAPPAPRPRGEAHA